MCHSANNSTTVFDLHGVDRDSQSTLSLPNSTSSFDPAHCSTPTRSSNQGHLRNRPLRILNANLQSAQGKRAELANLIDSTKPDILICTETWLTPDIQNSEFLPSTFITFRKDRSGKRGGGVLIAVRDNLQCTEVPELDTGGEMVWIKLQTKNERPLYLCACYRPDVSDTDGLQRFDTSLRRAAAINNAQILVAGDFNFPSWDWKQMSLKPRPSFPTLHQQFIDLLHDTTPAVY
jgi:endonuclease/exonuclease/phosphatase (EEP) superfamily protein YafD